MNIRKILLYCFISYTMCYGIAFTFFGMGGAVTSGWFFLIALACMFTPAIAAIFVQEGTLKDRFYSLGFTFTFNKWIVITCLLPVIITIAALFTGLLIPDIRLSNGEVYIHDQVSAVYSTEMADNAVESLNAMGIPLWLVLSVTGILAALLFGPTINAIPALGEELGWRGFLQKELSPLGFWKASVIVGIVWGFWHLPLIINGYNYPDNPIAGVFMMTLLTVLLSPILAQLHELSGTVLAPAIFHGVLNAVAGLPILFTIGYNSFLTGITGISGAAVLIICNIGLYFFRHRFYSRDMDLRQQPVL